MVPTNSMIPPMFPSMNPIGWNSVVPQTITTSTSQSSPPQALSTNSFNHQEPPKPDRNNIFFLMIYFNLAFASLSPFSNNINNNISSSKPSIGNITKQQNQINDNSTTSTVNIKFNFLFKTLTFF